MGTLLWRWNFAMDLTGGRVNGSSVDTHKLTATYNDQSKLASQFLGRLPTTLESEVLQSTNQTLALLLARIGLAVVWFHNRVCFSFSGVEKLGWREEAPVSG